MNNLEINPFTQNLPDVDAPRVALVHLGYEIFINSKELIVSNKYKSYTFPPHTSFKEIYNKLCPLVKAKIIPVNTKDDTKENKPVPVVNKEIIPVDSKPRRVYERPPRGVYEFKTNFSPKDNIQTPATIKSKPKKLTKTQKRREQRNRQKLRLIQEGIQCHYCEIKLTEHTFSWDHIIPKVSGGGNERKNKIPSCKDCNNRKSDTPYHDFTKKPLPTEYY